MTILTFQPPARRLPPARPRYVPNQSRKREVYVSLLVASAILTVCCTAALNGGLSINTGPVEMNLTGSLSQGLQIHFAAMTS